MSNTSKKILRGVGIAVVIFAVYAVVAIALQAYTTRQVAVDHMDGLTIEFLQSPLDYKALGDVSPDYDVTSAGVVVLNTAGGLRGLTASGEGGALTVRTTDASPGTAPTSIAVDRQDTLLAITDGYLGALGEDGALSHAVPLPHNNARLASSNNDGAVYLFGGTSSNYRLYRLLDDGMLQILLDSAEEIVAVTDSSQDIYVATPTTILQLRKEQPAVLFKAPLEQDWGQIISLVASPDRGLLFFSTASQVYALSSGGVARSVIFDSGGMLRLRGSKLYVLDRTRGLLFTATPAAQKIFAKTAS